MLKLKKVAITGGISCGKTEVGNCFKEHGAYVLDADEIVHRLLVPETELGQRVIDLLGKEIEVKGKIDRARVAKKVFLNPKLLRSLEGILHPSVYEEIEKYYNRVCQKENPPLIFVAEIPLLFETGGEEFFDETIAIIADNEKCWERYRKTTGNEREDYNRRMARQLSQDEKAKRADYVIHNNGSFENLHSEVDNLFEILCGLKVKKPKGK